MSIATPAFFWSLCVEYLFSSRSLLVYMCSLFWSGSLVDNIYRGLGFVSIQPVFVFCLGHSTHLHLRQLLISIIPLPFTSLFWVWVYKPFQCFLSREDPFSIYWKASLVVLNSLSFCLSEKLLISPSYLNEILAGYNNLGCRLFSFIILPSSLLSLCSTSPSSEAFWNHSLWNSNLTSPHWILLPLYLWCPLLSIALFIIWHPIHFLSVSCHSNVNSIRWDFFILTPNPQPGGVSGIW